MTPLPPHFVHVRDLIPDVLQSMRYGEPRNFSGRPAAGYPEESQAILTRPAAEALARVQKNIRADGLSLLIYDAYRPTKAVADFMAWAHDIGDQVQKELYYPDVNKADVFELGYLVEKSSHSRGSAVDLTVIPLSHVPAFHASKGAETAEQRRLKDGRSITFLRDGSVDMGCHFDFFDVASHPVEDLVSDTAQAMRLYLRAHMVAEGFEPYDTEWWHFALANEPFPETYFDFDVTPAPRGA